MKESGAAPLVNWDANSIRVTWPDRAVSKYDSLWLRDNLHEDRDPHSGQRLIDVADLPREPRIHAASVQDGTVTVRWENEERIGSFTLDWLAAHSAELPSAPSGLIPQLWLEGAALDPRRDFAWICHSGVRSDPRARHIWLQSLLRQGIAFLEGVPTRETALVETMSLVGRVCETNYGLTFDVRSVPQPENLAYSDLGLGLHTDNPYREPVPGFQALHALITSDEGGISLFADGFAVAEHLRNTAPEHFALLTKTPVPFRYRSKAAELFAQRPLIQLSCAGAVTAVHYNSRSIAPLRLRSYEAGPFYSAYRHFAELLRVPRYQLPYRLRDGDLVVFDNQRTLHGRTSFSSARLPRHLRGCYLTRDSVYSAAALLRRELDSGSPP